MKNTGFTKLFLLVGALYFHAAGAIAQEVPVAAVTREKVEFVLPVMAPGPPMTFTEAISLADSRNLTLQSATVEIEKMNALYKKSLAWVTPQVSGGFDYTHMDHSDVMNLQDSIQGLLDMLAPGVPLPPMEPMVLNPQDRFIGNVTVGVPLIHPEGWYTISAAKKGVSVVQNSVEAGRQTLLAAVATVYMQALAAKAYIVMQEEQVRSAAAQLEDAQLRVGNGAGVRIDVVRAQTDLAMAQQTLNTAHLMMENARDGIRMLTGATELPMPVEMQKLQANGDRTEKDLVDEAAKTRPDIRAAQQLVEVEDDLRKAAWMQFVPTLDAGWRFQYEFNDPPDLGSGDHSRWALLFSLAIPIYHQSRYGDLDYRRAALRQAMLDRDDKLLKVSTEVRKARRDYLSSLSELEIAERQHLLATEALQLTETAYRSGVGTSLEVTTARRDSMAAGANVISKRLNSQTRLVELLRAMGEDLRTLE